MTPDTEDLARELTATGFPAETLEKALRVLGLLGSLGHHPFLKPRIALKGGTALNLFQLDVPRLSVDIDLNYIGAASRSAMLAERPKFEQAIEAVCYREGLSVKRVPSEHAGGKWRLAYTAADGRPGSLALDINFMFRTPLWPTVMASSCPVGSGRVLEARVLDLHELAAGKLAALMARGACRDLFDVHELLGRDDLHRDRLRIGFVVYGGANREDWRTVSVGQLRADPEEMRRDLIPMLRADAAPGQREVGAWTAKLVSECRDLLSALLPLEENEREFIARLNERGEIVPSLITDDPSLLDIIERHPSLRWKAINVRRHRGIPLEGIGDDMA